MIQIAGGHHVDVNACPYRLERRFFIIFSCTVGNHFLNRGPIGNDNPFEAPFPAQQVTQQFTVSRGRNAIYDIERGHNHLSPGIYGLFISG
ncbi:hypothetical protein D3C75_885120 [compost metagenome]